MSRIKSYREKLRALQDWTPFLLPESGLPGPRGNLELAAAVAAEGDARWFERLLATPAEEAGENTPGVFLVFCGVLGLGRLVADGDATQLTRLRSYAGDERWRVREAVATALQLVGDADMPVLIREMTAWSRGTWLEKRAAAAALCEPRLLEAPKNVRSVLEILDAITVSTAAADDRSGAGFKALRQAMGYCWSVAVAALPAEGKPFMQKWIGRTDRDVRWIMKENLKKNRLTKADARWTAAQRARLDKSG